MNGEKRAKARAKIHASVLRLLGSPVEAASAQDRAGLVGLLLHASKRAIDERYRQADQPFPLLGYRALGCLALLACSLTAQAALTPVSAPAPGEPSLESILLNEYGSLPNRIDDDSDWLFDCPLTWRVIASHTAANPSFGCGSGVLYNAATGSPVVETVYSVPLLNEGWADHMVSFTLPGLWVVAFEDWAGPKSDRDFNDLVVEFESDLIHTPEPATIGLMGLSLVIWATLRRRKARVG